MPQPRLACLLLLLAVACRGRPEPSTDAPPPDCRNAEITIRVDNQHWLDINVYIIRTTLPDRIGTVTSQSSRVFVVPWAKVGNGQFRLAGDPVGQNRGLVTESIVVRPSSVVECEITSGMRQSNVAVY